MRLVTYRGEASERAGVDTGDGVIDAAAALGEQSASVRGLIAQDRIGELRERLESGIEGMDRIQTPELLPPITNPEKIVCIGLNYRSHAAEAGIDPPADPTLFAKLRNALSARDLQFATPQWMPGKVFDGSAPCGPALVTPDEAGPPDGISFALDLNGERMQEASTSDLIFPIAELVARLSRLMTLEPGDIVSTGTPAGVGSVRKPRVWLKAGDEISITSPTLGELRTTLG